MFWLQRLLALPFSARQRKLAQARTAIDVDAFVKLIGENGGDRAAAGFLWNLLSDSVFAKGFTPYPQDSFEVVYGLADEDKDDDVIRAAFEHLSISLPDKNTINAFGKIDSALSVAKFVALCRAKENDNALGAEIKQ
jgi:hypothetical protein